MTIRCDHVMHCSFHALWRCLRADANCLYTVQMATGKMFNFSVVDAADHRVSPHIQGHLCGLESHVLAMTLSMTSGWLLCRYGNTGAATAARTSMHE